MTNRRILCVDADPNALEALEQALGERFDVTTVQSGADALQILTAEGPFAAVMCDIWTPQMDGTAFLGRVQKLAPDTTRILLTAQADAQTSIDAVNYGGIFRFLVKPCPSDILEGALEDALEQHRRLVGDREMLEETLTGTMKMLSDFLGMVAPKLYAQSSRIRDCVSHMTNKLGLTDSWQYETAALLSQIGLVTVPLEVVERFIAGKNLTDGERKLIQDHPAAGHRLIAGVPRMDRVAAMIRDQQKPQPTEIAPVVIGAGMLRIAVDLDNMLNRGTAYAEALAWLVRQNRDPQLVAALREYRPPNDQSRFRAMALLQLKSGMILDEDARIPNGTVVITKGTALTDTSIERLKKFAQTIGLVEPINIRPPRRRTSRAVQTQASAASALLFGTKRRA